jgi:hypothetical protein
VLNGPLPSQTTEAELRNKIHEQVAQIRRDSNLSDQNEVEVSFVNAQHALHALDALAAGLEHTSSNQTRAFDTFQTEFLSSQIGPLQFTLLNHTATNPLPQLVTAQSIANLALSYISETIDVDRESTKQAVSTVSDLRHQAGRAAQRARHLSVVNRGIESGVVEGGVEQEMEETRRELDNGFKGRWSWLNLVGKLRVDDVGGEVAVYFERTFGRDLERQVSDCITTTEDIADMYGV